MVDDVDADDELANDSEEFVDVPFSTIPLAESLSVVSPHPMT
jgi:hypothetical protein